MKSTAYIAFTPVAEPLTRCKTLYSSLHADAYRDSEINCSGACKEVTKVLQPAIALRDALYERLAVCIFDGGSSDAEAWHVAMIQLREGVTCGS